MPVYTPEEYAAKYNLSPEEVISGLGTSFASGATFGTGGTISGLANILYPAKPSQGKTIGQLFREGQEMYKQSQEKFAQQHPYIATGTEIAASIPLALPTGGEALIGKAPLLAKLGKAALTGAEYGGAYGAGKQLENVVGAGLEGKSVAPSIKELLKQSGKSAVTGAALGTATVPVIGAMKGITGGFKNIFSREAKIPKVIEAAAKDVPIIEKIPAAKIQTEIPSDLIKQSIDTNTPLIDLGGSEIRRLSQTAKLANPKAEDILVKHAESTLEKQPKQLTETIEAVMGKKSKLQNLDDILTKYEAEAKPAYNKAFESGDLAGSNPEIVDLSKDEFLQNYIKKARNSAVGRELKGLPDTHIKVLDAAKQKLDDAINVAMRAGENKEARALMNLKSELTDKIDTVVPEYAQAREIASERFKLEDAQNSAKKIIKAENPESIAQIMPTLSEPEKEAFIVGLRDQMMEEISKGAKTGRTNIAERMFGSNEDFIVRQNLKSALGETDYNNLMEPVNKLVRAGYNASRLLGGSQTAQLESYKIPLTMKRFAKQKLSKLLTTQSRKSYEDVANMLTNPEYLKEQVSKYNLSQQAAYKQAMRNISASAPGSISSTQGEK